MITLIHGTNIALSRKYFLDLAQKEPDSNIIDGQNTDLTDFAQIFTGGELFAIRKAFFIERLVGKKSRKSASALKDKKNTNLEKITEYINENSVENDIYIWENSELTKTSLNLFKNPVNKLFNLPLALFLFLESLRPNNSKPLINLFHQSLIASDVEMVFFMIVRQVRILLELADPTNDPIDEVKKMAPWQKGKLQKQADYFELDKLIDIYSKLFEIEKNMKTGNLTLPLKQTIDLFLLEI